MKSRIEQCEQLLRAGQPSAVASALAGVNLARVGREDCLKLANICRRAGLFNFGLRLLTPFVRPDRRTPIQQASEAETAEYAVLLMKVGSIGEALHLLSPLQLPESSLYRAFCHMNQWEYAAAVPLLLSYLQQVPDGYTSTVARVNLCASLVNSGQDSFSVLESTLNETTQKDYGRLTANLLELRAHVHVAENRDEQATEDLDRAFEILRGQKTNDQIYLHKWRAILAARRTRDLAPLNAFQIEAAAAGDWESVRETDLQKLILSFDEDLYGRLLFGTPWSDFRTRVQKRVVGSPSLPPVYRFGSESGRCLDLTSGTFDDEREFNAGQKILRMLAALSSDLYAPHRIGSLFAQIFPQEHYHVLYSPNRVHQLLWRTRTWLKRESLPLIIEEVGGRMRLKLTGDFALKIALERSEEPEVDGPLMRLRRGLPEEFSAKQAQQLLRVSEPTARRLIQKSLRDGKILKQRRGRKISYRLAA